MKSKKIIKQLKGIISDLADDSYKPNQNAGYYNRIFINLSTLEDILLEVKYYKTKKLLKQHKLKRELKK